MFRSLRRLFYDDADDPLFARFQNKLAVLIRFFHRDERVNVFYDSSVYLRAPLLDKAAVIAL